jgi:hypothetical protein
MSLIRRAVVSWSAKPDLTGARCGHPIGTLGSKCDQTRLAAHKPVVIFLSIPG